MDRNTPLFDTSLADLERAEYLISQMTLEEKFTCFSLRLHIPRLGIFASTCGGEGAHGVQARAGQREMYPPTPTTSFTQPIGMAATFDRDLIRRAGDVTGKESRAFGKRGRERRPRPPVPHGRPVPGPALGTERGRVRRRPVPHRQNGFRVHRRNAGRA